MTARLFEFISIQMKTAFSIPFLCHIICQIQIKIICGFDYLDPVETQSVVRAAVLLKAVDFLPSQLKKNYTAEWDLVKT